MRTLSPKLNMGFLYCRSAFPCRMYENSKLLTFLGIKSIEQNFLEIRVVTNWDFVNVLLSTILYETVKTIVIKDRNVRSANAALVSLIVEKIRIPSAKIVKLCSKICSLVDPNFHGSIHFCNHS